jgi:hypothetical protein
MHGMTAASQGSVRPLRAVAASATPITPTPIAMDEVGDALAGLQETRSPRQSHRKGGRPQDPFGRKDQAEMVYL